MESVDPMVGATVDWERLVADFASSDPLPQRTGGSTRVLPPGVRTPVIRDVDPMHRQAPADWQRSRLRISRRLGALLLTLRGRAHASQEEVEEIARYARQPGLSLKSLLRLERLSFAVNADDLPDDIGLLRFIFLCETYGFSPTLALDAVLGQAKSDTERGAADALRAISLTLSPRRRRELEDYAQYLAQLPDDDVGTSAADRLRTNVGTRIRVQELLDEPRELGHRRRNHA